MNRFIDHYKENGVATKYNAGRVKEYENGFIISYQQQGAEDTFSIGQPVYDEDKHLMGYLGIGLFRHLDYSADGQIRIPVEHWTIDLPTEHCVGGKKVYTYWQTVNKEHAESEENCALTAQRK